MRDSTHLAPSAESTTLRTLRGMLAATLIALALTALAFPSVALAHETGGSTCIVTDEQRAAYEADGTLEARIAFQKALGNDQPSPELIQQAIARQDAENGMASRSVSGSWESGMATQGRAHVLALRVSFPDYETFSEGDTLEALQALVGPRDVGGSPSPLQGASPFPYESLNAYYMRASYETLIITGEALDYRAKHERDYYTGDIGELFREALAALDETEDLARFDANKDGRLDAVYVHFAGPDTGWGSTWWSNEQNLSSPDAVYENGTVGLWNAVMLANPANRDGAGQTIIHETGHVLGLPDYYQYVSQQGGSTERTGILTFDMMMDNQGDHNGFSKWLLGWLDGSDVTRIVANDRETVVKRGRDVVTQDPAGAVVEQELHAFTADSAADTGGIIVLSNQDEGMFSSYYVLQYDRYAGNQSVQYADSEGTHALPSGLRMFRVQAALTSDGLDYATTNSNGTVHNQLIELVDPDMNAVHSQTQDTVPAATENIGYGCMLYKGDSVTPQGYPSTNFFENANIGFTGLSVSVQESATDRGRVRISHSNAGKPVVPTGLALKPLFDTVPNVGMLEFEASSALAFPETAHQVPQLIVDGKHHELFNTTVEGTRLRVPCMLDAVDIAASSSCEIVFPAGMFVLSRTATETMLSPEVRLTLSPNANMTSVDRAGLFTGTEYEDVTTFLSNVIVCAEGERRFFQAAGGTLRLHTLDADNPGRVASIDVDAPNMLSTTAIQSLAAIPLENGTVFLAMAANETSTGSCYWVDPQDGRVLASCALESGGTRRYIADGNTVIATDSYHGETEDGRRGGTLLTSLAPKDGGAVSMRYGWTAAEATATANPTTLACGFFDSVTEKTTEVRLVDAASIASALAESTRNPFDAALGGEVCTRAAARTTIPVQESRIVLDAAERAGICTLLLGSSLGDDSAGADNLVMRFDASGTEQARAPIAPPSSDETAYTRMIAGEHGAVALLARAPLPSYSITKSSAQFLDDGLRPLSQLTTASSTDGAWLADGRWIDIGRSISASSGPKGSPIQETDDAESDGRPRVYYTITAHMDAPKPVDPDVPPVPDTPSNPDSPKQDASGGQPSVQAKALAGTGDATATAAPTTAAIAFAALSGLALLRLRRKQAK